MSNITISVGDLDLVLRNMRDALLEQRGTPDGIMLFDGDVAGLKLTRLDQCFVFKLVVEKCE